MAHAHRLWTHCRIQFWHFILRIWTVLRQRASKNNLPKIFVTPWMYCLTGRSQTTAIEETVNMTCSVESDYTVLQDVNDLVSRLLRNLCRSVDVVHFLLVFLFLYSVHMMWLQLAEVINSWGPDVFQINEMTNNRPLTAVVYTIFRVSFLTSHNPMQLRSKFKSDTVINLIYRLIVCSDITLYRWLSNTKV